MKGPSQDGKAPQVESPLLGCAARQETGGLTGMKPSPFRAHPREACKRGVTGSPSEALILERQGSLSLGPKTKVGGQDHFPAGSRKRSSGTGKTPHGPPLAGTRRQTLTLRLQPQPRSPPPPSFPAQRFSPTLPANSFRFESTAHRAPEQAIGCPASGRDQGALRALIGRRLLARWRAAWFGAGAVRAGLGGRAGVLRLRTSL